MSKKEEKIKIVEKENAALRGCIGDVLTTLSDYDGHREAKGLMGLIDEVVETLKSRYPDRIVDHENREVCPLCFKRKD